MSRTDWSKAGTRIRHSPYSPHDAGHNPDWNGRLRRWKVAEEYAGQSLTPAQIVARVSCQVCAAPVGAVCTDSPGREMDHPHAERLFAAGASLIETGEWTMPTNEPARVDCGRCYGNGCSDCSYRGTVETQAGREAREEWEDGAYDRAHDERIMEGGR